MEPVASSGSYSYVGERERLFEIVIRSHSGAACPTRTGNRASRFSEFVDPSRRLSFSVSVFLLGSLGNLLV